MLTMQAPQVVELIGAPATAVAVGLQQPSPRLGSAFSQSHPLTALTETLGDLGLAVAQRDALRLCQAEASHKVTVYRGDAPQMAALGMCQQPQVGSAFVDRLRKPSQVTPRLG